MYPKDAERIADSAHPDQTALGTVWSESAEFMEFHKYWVSTVFSQYFFFQPLETIASVLGLTSSSHYYIHTPLSKRSNWLCCPWRFSVSSSISIFLVFYMKYRDQAWLRSIYSWKKYFSSTEPFRDLRLRGLHVWRFWHQHFTCDFFISETFIEFTLLNLFFS